MCRIAVTDEQIERIKENTVKVLAAEIDRLRAELAAAKAGAPRPVIVVGEPIIARLRAGEDVMLEKAILIRASDLVLAEPLRPAGYAWFCSKCGQGGSSSTREQAREDHETGGCNYHMAIIAVDQAEPARAAEGEGETS